MCDSSISRRSLIVGGLAVPLVGCGPEGQGSGTGGGSGTSGGSGGSGGTSSTVEWPSWTEIGLYLTMATVAGSAGSLLAGAVGLARLAGVLSRISTFADRAGTVVEAIEFLNGLRAQRFALPTLTSTPAAFAAPQSGEVNAFDAVPIFKNDTMLRLGVLNEEGGNFGEYDLYATIKRVEDAPPRTLNDVWGNGDLPHVIVQPNSDESFGRHVPMTPRDPGAYVPYSWKVPRGQQPSDAFIADNAFIGAAFLALDDASYSYDIDAAVDAGRNVEARFQLPDARYI